jgi:hypothetical protein
VTRSIPHERIISDLIDLPGVFEKCLGKCREHQSAYDVFFVVIFDKEES